MLKGKVSGHNCSVIRGKEKGGVLKAIQAVSQGGINVIEVTFTVPGAAGIIKEPVATMSEEIILGAGTVISRKYRPVLGQDAIAPGEHLDFQQAQGYFLPLTPGAL